MEDLIAEVLEILRDMDGDTALDVIINVDVNAIMKEMNKDG